MTETLTSTSNPKVKKLIALQQKHSERRESNLFVVEGKRELEHCINSNYSISSLFYCIEIIEGVSSEQFGPAGTCRPRQGSGCQIPRLAQQGVKMTGSEEVKEICKVANFFDSCDSQRVELALKDTRIFEISKEIYQKVAYREGTEGIIAEVRAKEKRLEDLKLKENPLVVVLESVEKPGNLGAVLRSADAAGADAVLICDPLTDLYNPNLIRASIGAVFTVPCVVCSSAEAISWLKLHGVQILTAQLQDSEWYYDTDMERGTAIVIGTEATGLTQAWRDAADAHIKIPMLGALDSLNASVSAAILLFEAVRQRERIRRSGE